MRQRTLNFAVMSRVIVYWFRKALRLHDNPSLLKAIESSSSKSSLAPIFILGIGSRLQLCCLFMMCKAYVFFFKIHGFVARSVLFAIIT